MKRHLIAVLSVLLLVALAVLAAVPELRLNLLGLRLAHRMGPGALENLAVVTYLRRGQQILGPGVGSSGVPQQAFDIRVLLEESLEDAGEEEIFRYRVRELRSEQLGLPESGSLVGAVYEARVRPHGLLAGLRRQEGKPSQILDEGRLATILAAVWPRLPAGPVRPGAIWRGSFEVELSARALQPASLVLDHRLDYRLEGFERCGGGRAARVSFKGRIIPRPRGEVPPGVVISGSGTTEGYCLVDGETGRTLLGDLREDVEVTLRDRSLPGAGEEGLALVSALSQHTRFWRPGAVPDGLEGFEGPSGVGPEPE